MPPLNQKKVTSSNFGECSLDSDNLTSDNVNSSSVDRDVHTAVQEARTGFQPTLFFFVASAFYFYEFFARVAFGVLKSDIRSVSGSREG